MAAYREGLYALRQDGWELGEAARSHQKPGGTLLACVCRLLKDGPPFPGLPAGRRDGPRPFFRIVEAGPPPGSPERRRGLEWLVRAEQRDG